MPPAPLAVRSDVQSLTFGEVSARSSVDPHHMVRRDALEQKGCSVRFTRKVRRCVVACAIVASGLATAEPQRAVANQVVPFTQPLRIPPVYTAPNIDVTMREACVQILPGPCTNMWTYDGMFPGPTIRRPSGKTTRVTFANELPDEVGSTTVHHHGSHSESRFDGQPHSYLIAPGKKFTYEYDFMERGEPERAAFQWYHDHRMDVTGRNVWMGLAGMFLLDDEFDASLPLPKGKHDVPLMVVDRSFDENNQLDYKFSSASILGDHILVNGVPSPYFEVADRKYRFRILNASNFREYRFELGNGQEMVQVASESGLLPQPVRRKSIVLGPAERAEVVIDFAGHLGEDIVLANTNPPAIDPAKPEPENVPSQVMQFRVRHQVSDKSHVPEQLRPAPQFGNPAPVPRVFTLGVIQGAGALHRQEDAAPQRFLWTINGRAFDPERVDAQPALDSTERWIFVNNTVGQHRVHIHDVDWKIVSRRGGVQLLTPGDPDAALSEAGLRETFLVQSGETVEVEAKFADRLGPYVLHCHILEHEDNGMMAQFEVVPPGSSGPADHEAEPSHSHDGHDHGGGHHDAPSSSDSSEAHDGGAGDEAMMSVGAPDAGNASTPASGGHAALEMRPIARRPHHHGASPDGARGFPIVMALAVLALGVAAGALALRRKGPSSSRLAAVALALQLGGLGWDMAVHAAAGEPLDLFENAGHLVAMGGILLLAAVVALPSLPPGLLRAHAHGQDAQPPPPVAATDGPPRVHV